MANTGMRVGEITGLRWCDVDFKTGLINVNHTLVYYNHRDEHGLSLIHISRRYALWYPHLADYRVS